MSHQPVGKPAAVLTSPTAGPIECCGLTDTGCVRKNNEDAYRVQPEQNLYLLADGMGGARAGEHASNMAVDAVIEYVTGHADMGPAEVLRGAFLHANSSVLAAANADGHLEGMGTTLVGAMVSGGDLIICSVGDSRAYSFRQGRLSPLTEDQSWVNEVGRMQLGLEEDLLRSHPMRNVLTMAIGVGEPVRINSYRYPLEPGTIILLSSDGLHGVISVREIEEILGRETGLDAMCRELIDRAKARGGPDNITTVLLRA